jgi:hypothetical protein
LKTNVLLVSTIKVWQTPLAIRRQPRRMPEAEGNTEDVAAAMQHNS